MNSGPIWHRVRRPNTPACVKSFRRCTGTSASATCNGVTSARFGDEKAETPGAANTRLQILKILLNFAVDDGLIDFSPAAKMRELKVGEWRAWTDDECAAFEKRWNPGAMQRRAYAVALYTGQRKKDQITRTRTHRQDGGICVVQSKTGEELWIPEHRALTKELALGVATLDTLLVTPTQGKPFDEVYYGAWFADAIEEAGLPDDCVLHGLRKCASRKQAELGLSEKVIQSITGHVTTRMIAKYTKGCQSAKAREAGHTALGEREVNLLRPSTAKGECQRAGHPTNLCNSFMALPTGRHR